MTKDWDIDGTPDPVHGRLDMLQNRFTTIADAAGILAFCVDVTDPAFPGGSAVLLSGDDEYYKQTSPRFASGRLIPLVEALAAAKEALPRVCRVTGHLHRERYSLRSRNALAVPGTLPRDSNPTEHPGFLAANTDFAVLVSPCGESLDNPQFVLMMTDPETGDRQRVYSASVHWLRWVLEAATDAAKLSVQQQPSSASPDSRTQAERHPGLSESQES